MFLDMLSTASGDENFTIVAERCKKRAHHAVNLRLFFTHDIMKKGPPENEAIVGGNCTYASCSLFKEHFPELASHVDSFSYMDSGTSIVSKVRDLWTIFPRMNSTQWLAAANEDEPEGDGWYTTKAMIPHYGQRIGYQTTHGIYMTFSKSRMSIKTEVAGALFPATTYGEIWKSTGTSILATDR